MKKEKIFYLLGLVIFLIAIAVGVSFLIRDKASRDDAEQTLDELATEVNDVKKTAEESEDLYSSLGITISEKNLDWNELHKKNADIYAWITVTDTTIDYPVLQHSYNNAYYLDHNIDGSTGYPGCIYTEDYNAKDFSDLNTVLYGHNLKDKTMFSSLHNFEDEETFNKDQYIYVYTESDVFVYKIFAAYEFKSDHLILNYDYSNEYVYEQYIKDIFNVADKGYGPANIKSGVEVTKEDKIITLSTCTSDHDSSQRYLVAGVLIDPNKESK